MISTKQHDERLPTNRRLFAANLLALAAGMAHPVLAPKPSPLDAPIEAPFRVEYDAPPVERPRSDAGAHARRRERKRQRQARKAGRLGR